MKKLMKRALSVVMTLALCLSLLPSTAFAWDFERCQFCQKYIQGASGWYDADRIDTSKCKHTVGEGSTLNLGLHTGDVGGSIGTLHCSNCHQYFRCPQHKDSDAPQHSENAAHDHKCDYCHAEYFQFTTTTTTATCYAGGTTTTICGYNGCTVSVPDSTVTSGRLDPNWGACVETVNADGTITHTQTCTRCGSDARGPAEGHVRSDTFTPTVTGATCDVAGSTSYTCKFCGTHTTTGTKLSPDFTDAPYVQVDATQHKQECVRPGCSHNETGHVKYENHNFGDWSWEFGSWSTPIADENSVFWLYRTANGKRVCADCGYEETATVKFEDTDRKGLTDDQLRKEPGAKTFTIAYLVKGAGTSAAPLDTVTVHIKENDASVSVAVKDFAGYEFDSKDRESISYDDDADRVVHVYYTPNVYNVVINYVDDDTKTEVLHVAHTEPVTFGGTYSVLSPEIPGYELADATHQATVSGTMNAETVKGLKDGDTLTITVPYKILVYTWIVNYEFANDEATQAADKTNVSLPSNTTETFTIETRNDLSAKTVSNVGIFKPSATIVAVPQPTWTEDAEKRTFINTVYFSVQNSKNVQYQFVDENGEVISGPIDTNDLVYEGGDPVSVTPGTVPDGYELNDDATKNATYDDPLVSFVVRRVNLTLTVYHEYYNEAGTLDHSVTVNGGTFTMGQSYTTSPRYEARFDLSATPANASGTFGAGNVAVTYVYNASTGGGTPPTPPVEESNPPESPSPEVDLPEPELPLAETPELPEVDLSEPELPLTEAPEVEVDLPQIPTTDASEDIVIEDSDLPLADVPQTGDISGMWCAAALPVCGLGLVFSLKKREDEEA